MKRLIKWVPIFIVIAVLAFFISIYKPKVEYIPLQNEAYAWVAHDQFYGIAHRLGPKDTGENRIATFYKALEQGFRFFEVDLMLTSDQKLICYHGKSSDEEISYAAYVAASQELGYAPCSIDDLIQLAVAHPDIYFILDVKNERSKFEEAYQIIKEKVAAAGVGYSFIPQIYFIKQSPFIRKDQIFSVEIYTGYRTGDSNQEMFEQARSMQIPVVTFDLKRIERASLPFPKDLLIFTHPVNDLAQAMALKQKGVNGIFTSDLSPLLNKELYQ